MFEVICVRFPVIFNIIFGCSYNDIIIICKPAMIVYSTAMLGKSTQVLIAMILQNILYSAISIVFYCILLLLCFMEIPRNQ